MLGQSSSIHERTYASTVTQDYTQCGLQRSSRDVRQAWLERKAVLLACLQYHMHLLTTHSQSFNNSTLCPCSPAMLLITQNL